MNRNKIYIDNALIKDLQTYASSVCVSLATTVRDELYEEAKLAIDAFYEDYTPLYYKRHKYNFKKNSFIKYYKNPHNSIVCGGIELTPNELDDLYRAEPEYVFDLVYLGYHGNVELLTPYQKINNIPPVMEPGPYEILLDKRDWLVKNINNYKILAVNKAKEKQYTTLRV